MRLKYEDERVERIPCANKDCHYWDDSWVANCSKEQLDKKEEWENFGPDCIGICDGYIPERVG